jgi:hypothetical protein
MFRDFVTFKCSVKMSPVKEMEGKTPFEKLRSLGYGLPRELALLLPVILNPISTDCLLQTSNNLPAYYILSIFFLFPT